MKHKDNLQAFSAARATAMIFGVLAGLGGLTHGIGEVLQGNVQASGIIINSWTQGPIAAYMGGEPAMTIVPNLLVTGLLNILVSLTVIIWAVWVRDPKGGRILLLLSFVMLLVGGGFGPPIMGILAGLAGIGIGAPLIWWRERLSGSLRNGLAAVWPWVFGIAVANGVFLVIGSLIAIYFFDLNNPDLFTNSFYLSVILLLLTIITGKAYEAQQHRHATAI